MTEQRGTIPHNIQTLAHEIIGHRIIHVENGGYYGRDTLAITLENGKIVIIRDNTTNTAYTEVEYIIYRAENADNAITDITTDHDYQRWHILAGTTEVLHVGVQWGAAQGSHHNAFNIELVDTDPQEAP